jgi:hypothetical protein
MAKIPGPGVIPKMKMAMKKVRALVRVICVHSSVVWWGSILAVNRSAVKRRNWLIGTFLASSVGSDRMLKKACCLFQHTRTKNDDFCFSLTINDLTVINFAGTSMFR